MKILQNNKRAQVYTLFVAIFTVVALTTALTALSDSKEITDAEGNKLYVGTKQFAVFAALQDADGVNLFLDQTSELAAQRTLKTIRQSCFFNPSTEHVVDEWISPCGKYVYPKWSSTDTLCLPDCETAFINVFKDDFIGQTRDYYRNTGVDLPLSYNLTIENKEN